MVEQMPFEENRMEIQAVQEAEKHIRNNIIQAKDGRKCVDGRYNLGTGEIARAGGDMGYVEVLLALNTSRSLGLTPEQCFDLVYDYSTKEGGKFFMHTDTHADPFKEDSSHGEKPLIGCGHCAKAANPQFSSLYQLQSDEIQRTVEYARGREAQGDAIEMVVLEGEHAEKGTIIVDSDSYSVNAQDKDGESMYFIYDKKRDEAYMSGLVSWLRTERQLHEVTFEDFQTSSGMQTNATLHILAPGTPILQVAIDEKGQAAKPAFVTFTS